MGPNEIAYLTGVFAAVMAVAQAQEITIEINAGRIIHPVSRHLTGACIEDVNHEIYGGLYSQMIFGESFQEPPMGQGALDEGVSGMWRPERSGTVAGGFDL